MAGEGIEDGVYDDDVDGDGDIEDDLVAVLPSERVAVALGEPVLVGLNDGRAVARDVPLAPEGDTALFTTSTTRPFPLLMPTLGM